MLLTTRRTVLMCCLLIAAIAVAQAQPYEPTWESLMKHEATPQWYEDAVLGFYFHWGPYSVPAFSCSGYWTMYIKGSETYELVKRKYGEPGIGFGYKDFVPMWKADKYDPDEWARLFKYAGADFAGPGAEHHDGFALWRLRAWVKVLSGPMSLHRFIFFPYLF